VAPGYEHPVGPVAQSLEHLYCVRSPGNRVPRVEGLQAAPGCDALWLQAVAPYTPGCSTLYSRLQHPILQAMDTL